MPLSALLYFGRFNVRISRSRPRKPAMTAKFEVDSLNTLVDQKLAEV
ncbi:toxin-antitoxin system HicB family antitoxin [Corynebacterium bovis]